MKVKCACGHKHFVRGYPIVCVKTQLHYCPTCGADLKGEEKGAMGQPIYSGEPCYRCGWKPEDI